MRTRLIAAALAAVCALAFAGQADAKDLTFPSVELKKSKGFSGFVSSSEKGDEITLGVNGKSGNAYYTVKGKASAQKIRATFKGFGKINLKFVPKGKPETNPPPDGCKGPKSELQDGTWVGKLSFKGEGGYVSFSGSKFNGSVFTRPDKPIKCDTPDIPTPTPKPCVFANANIGDLNVSGSAIEGKKPSWNVFSNEEKNGVEISKNISVDGGTLTVNSEAQTGKVAPPSPFSGSGDIAEGMLTGNLEVDVLGTKFNLAGDGWSVSEGTCS